MHSKKMCHYSELTIKIGEVPRLHVIEKVPLLHSTVVKTPHLTKDDRLGMLLKYTLNQSILTFHPYPLLIALDVSENIIAS